METTSAIVCDPRSYGNQPLDRTWFYRRRSDSIFCDRLRSQSQDRRRAQKQFPYDRRRSQTLLRSAICDPRSYGNQPLDRTWFYLLRSSAITIAGSQTIADLIAICDLRSAIRDHMETSLYLLWQLSDESAVLMWWDYHNVFNFSLTVATEQNHFVWILLKALALARGSSRKPINRFPLVTNAKDADILMLGTHTSVFINLVHKNSVVIK